MVLFSARTDRPARPDRPPSLVLKPRYYHQCSIILAYMFDHPQTRSGGFLEGVWTVSRECLEGFWEISGRVRNVSGGCLHIIFDPKIILNPKFLWPNIFGTLGLYLGFSAKLRIWQVAACKIEPQHGIIVMKPPTHP